MKRLKFIGAILLIPVIPLVGYAIIELLVTFIPEDSFVGTGLVYLVIIMLGITIPYLMIKTGFFAAHMNNRREKLLNLKDLPKNEKPAVRQQ